jgi:hypothetical protein
MNEEKFILSLKGAAEKGFDLASLNTKCGLGWPQNPRYIDWFERRRLPSQEGRQAIVNLIGDELGVEPSALTP